MGLPVNSTPIYTTTIPSTKKEFKFRPFLVKDEKALLIAQQSEDQTVMLDTAKEVIKSCAKSEVDVNKLASFDVEYLFLQLRAKSVGEFVQLIFQCDEDHGELNEKAKSVVDINLEEAKVEFFEGHTNKIPLFGDVGVMMKYPTIDTLKKIEQLSGGDIDQMIEIVIECVECIYDSDEVHYAKDQSKADLVAFFNNLTNDQFESVRTFFTTMPQLRVNVEYTCPVCQKHHKKYMEGLSSFF